MIQIRRATAADASVLARLRWMFRSDADRVGETERRFVRRCTAWMKRALGPRGEWRAWVAVERGIVVGQVWLLLFAKLPNPVGEREHHAYLSNLFVDPAVRGGVGTRLLDAALGFADRAGADRVLLWPSARSVTLYRRRGFTRSGDVMERSSPRLSAAPRRRPRPGRPSAKS